MFTDSNNQKPSQNSGFGQEKVIKKPSGFLFYFVTILITLLVVTLFYFVLFHKKPPVVTNGPGKVNNGPVATSTGGLPPDQPVNGPNNNGNNNGHYAIEYLNFGNFYEPANDDFVSALETYELPINVKTDVTNYFDISRKLSLDNHIENLNVDGFAVLPNEFSREADNFFDAFRLLTEKNIPVFISNDFIFYYYQNKLKEVFKEIEETVFYDNLWDLNMKLFDKARDRYFTRLTQVGNVNDVILEAARLEAAYFAVALQILKPTESQIDTRPGFTDRNKFSEQEAGKYDYLFPDFLKVDVEKEVQLIRAAKVREKSPVLLYQKDYAYYVVPAQYKDNAKLNNFYLTTKWLNTVFPLYYLSEECPDCLLDKNDWLINMTAALFISEDLSDNEELKRNWAVIYKFISFFTGLRFDLTYIQYKEAFENIFGEEKNVEDLFLQENINIEEALGKIQEILFRYEFSDLEGTFPRGETLSRPKLGMRLLQEEYWPNEYILERLTGKDMVLNYEARSAKETPNTACGLDRGRYYRCIGFGMDIINLFKPIKGSDYFEMNTNYTDYDQKVNQVKDIISRFNDFTWNQNVYWLTIDVAKNILHYNDDELPIFMRNDNWKTKKDINTALGAWVNLHLPQDRIINYFEKGATSLGLLSECNLNNYVEPNYFIINDLIQRNKMFLEMLKYLQITDKTNAAVLKISFFNEDLEKINLIIKKQLSNEEINEDDCKFLNEIMFTPLIEKKSPKSFNIHSAHENKTLAQNIDNIKFVIVAYKKGDRKYFAVGPIFNYFEK